MDPDQHEPSNALDENKAERPTLESLIMNLASNDVAQGIRRDATNLPAAKEKAPETVAPEKPKKQLLYERNEPKANRPAIKNTSYTPGVQSSAPKSRLARTGPETLSSDPAGAPRVTPPVGSTNGLQNGVAAPQNLVPSLNGLARSAPDGRPKGDSFSETLIDVLPEAVAAQFDNRPGMDSNCTLVDALPESVRSLLGVEDSLIDSEAVVESNSSTLVDELSRGAFDSNPSGVVDTGKTLIEPLPAALVEMLNESSDEVDTSKTLNEPLPESVMTMLGQADGERQKKASNASDTANGSPRLDTAPAVVPSVPDTEPAIAAGIAPETPVQSTDTERNNPDPFQTLVDALPESIRDYFAQQVKFYGIKDAPPTLIEMLPEEVRIALSKLQASLPQSAEIEPRIAEDATLADCPLPEDDILKALGADKSHSALHRALGLFWNQNSFNPVLELDSGTVVFVARVNDQIIRLYVGHMMEFSLFSTGDDSFEGALTIQELFEYEIRDARLFGVRKRSAELAPPIASRKMYPVLEFVTHERATGRTATYRMRQAWR